MRIHLCMQQYDALSTVRVAETTVAHNVLDLPYSSLSSLPEYGVVSVVCRTTRPIPSGIGYT
jgi:hypothetical protein